MGFFRLHLVGIFVLSTFLVFAENKAWENQLSFGADYKSGNTKKSLYIFDLKREKYTDSNDWINGLYSEYGETEGLQSEGLIRAYSEYRSRFNDSRFFSSILVQGVHDSIRSIKLRAKFGPNLGVYLINKSKVKLDLTVGLNSTYERGVENEEAYAGYRFSLNFKWYLNNVSSTYSKVEFSGNTGDPFVDYYGWLILGVKSSLLDDISLFAELRNDYNNVPDLDITKKNDVLVNLGLSYVF